MGLLPSWLDNCGGSLFTIYNDAADAILADMARRIATYDYYIPAAEYQRRVLTEMGATQQYILSELSKRTGKTQTELKQIMQEAGIEAVRSDADIYRRHGKAVPDQASAVMQNILAAGYQQTAGAFDNLCRTTARAGSSQFLRELNTAWLMVSGGGMSLDQATRAAIKRLAASGLDAVSYASGRKLSLDSAVRMTVRTGINQTAAKLQLQFAAEMDSDLVEVTAHAGARPSHAEWQGKVYSISGKTKGYRKLEDATGYGTVDGLCGANCRHNMFPFFEGESGAYSKRELEEYTKPDAVTYNGKSMSLYEAQQLQRYQERQIRRWKREYVCSEAAGIDTSQAAAKLAEWNSTHADFLQQTGLKVNSSRLTGTAAKTLVKSAKRGIINTGSIAGALDPLSPRAEKHAIQYYESVRHMKTDAERIAKNTGWEKEKIAEIKNHVFIQEHDLLDGHRRFDPSFEMAQSWQRLIEGKDIRECDLVLLKHEYLELTLMKKGYSQNDAHIIASKKYDYASAVERE